LIVFDKVFGTYVCETEHLDYYGLARQYETFDPIWASVEHGARVVKNVDNGSSNPILALFKRRVKHKWVFDPMALFRPNPQPKQSLWIMPKTSYRTKLDTKIPFILSVYLTSILLLQLVVFLLQSEAFKVGSLDLGWELVVRQGLFFVTVSCIGRLFDGFQAGRPLNTLRVLVTPILVSILLPQDSFLYYTSLADSVFFICMSMSLVGTAHG